MISSLQSSLPLLVFGAGRLLAVKATDYHEHVSEYGVHWNFFFTLVIVKVCLLHFFSLFKVGIGSIIDYDGFSSHARILGEDVSLFKPRLPIFLFFIKWRWMGMKLSW